LSLLVESESLLSELENLSGDWERTGRRGKRGQKSNEGTRLRRRRERKRRTGIVSLLSDHTILLGLLGLSLNVVDVDLDRKRGETGVDESLLSPRRDKSSFLFVGGGERERVE